MANYKMNMFVLWGSIVLFALISLISIFMINSFLVFISGFFISAMLSLMKFFMNNYYFSEVLSRKRFNGFLYLFYNIIFVFLLSFSILLLYKLVGYIDINIAAGMLIGVLIIPIVLIVESFLEVKYFIRNKK